MPPQHGQTFNKSVGGQGSRPHHSAAQRSQPLTPAEIGWRWNQCLAPKARRAVQDYSCVKMYTLRYINSAAGSFRPIKSGPEIFDKCATSPMVASDGRTGRHRHVSHADIPVRLASLFSIHTRCLFAFRQRQVRATCHRQPMPQTPGALRPGFRAPWLPATKNPGRRRRAPIPATGLRRRFPG